MKARTNCQECRKRIYKEAETEYLKREYAFFHDSAYSMAVYAICGVLATLVRRGRTKQYIKQMYEDMCFFYDTPEMFGKEITMTDIMHRLTQEYDIDWNKLNVHIEKENEFIHDARKGESK